ncbi:glucose-6-phosphate isomerase [Malacoplasma muris]|uniref:glucose-6-phosphate isomerase n=1 Tax=Malacoplasma muris TaxID=2119 RepID=UPI00398F6A13
MIKIDFSSFDTKISKEIMELYKDKVKDIHKIITNKTCPGGEMLGWMDYPFNYDTNELNEIISFSQSWRKNDNIKTLVVLGIGGSYLGLKAAIEMCLPAFDRDREIIYVYNLSSNYIVSLLKKLKKENFYLICISKSGTTLETAVAFRLFYELMFNKVGGEVAKERMVCITDKEKGKLRQIVNKYNLKSFVIPSDVGGRFSAITPVGLFAMAYMGLDVQQILKGCQAALNDTNVSTLSKNTAYKYAVARHYCYEKLNKSLEVFGVYEPNMHYLTEHWKQLMAESEGKNHKGLYPTNCLFTTDLHSVGQFLQEGSPIFFETILHVENPNFDKKIESFMNDDDGLNFVNNKTINQLNKIACLSTIDAHHIDGNTPIIQLYIDKMDEYHFGYLYSWLSKVVAMSALLLGVNPFDQPGVEQYKKRMFKKLKENI